MPTYLLTVANHAYESVFHTNCIVEAEDRQMVKYHYHRTQKDCGGGEAGLYNKHAIKMPGDYITDIESIRRIDDEEVDVLSEHLPSWPKV